MRRTIKPFLAGLAVIFLGSFVAAFFNLYDTFPHIDKIFHIASGFIIAWFFSNLWEDNFKGFNRFQRVIMFMALAGLIGFFWEVLEYSTSTSLFTHYQLIRHYFYGGDLTDTLGDLLADVLGGAIFGLL